MSSNETFRSLASTFVITEEEMHVVVRSRKKLIRKIKEKAVVYDMNQIVGVKAEVFCIDISLVMLSLSFEAYYDPPGIGTVSGYGLMDIEQYGYLVVDFVYHEELDMFCYVARHALSNNLVVCFRGSSSKIHWKHNLNFKQKEIDLEHMPLLNLDATDGYQEFVDQYNEVVDDGRESDEEFEDDEDAARHSTGRKSSFTVNRQEDSEDSTNDPKAGRKSLIQTVRGGATRMKQSVRHVAHRVGDATHTAVDATTGIIKSAAYITPGLRKRVAPFVHSGFFEAYEGVREFVHRTLRRELAESPSSSVYFTGHSLGGALATFAAVDAQIHTISRVNAWLRIFRIRAKLGLLNKPVTPPNHSSSPVNNGGDSAEILTGAVAADTAASDSIRYSLQKYAMATNRVKEVKTVMYNFGSPRVGNGVFVQQFNRLVPDCFRVEVDGDVVTGVPKGSYRHVGTNITVDALGAGSIIIDPSYIERRLRTRTKAHVSVHSLLVYRQGIQGVKSAAQFMQQHARERESSTPLDALDSVKLAISAGPLKIWSMLGGSENSKPNLTEESDTDTVLPSRKSETGGFYGDSGALSLDEENPAVAVRRPLVDTDKEAEHLKHDNEVNESLFSSIREQQERPRHALSPLMMRSIRLFRFKRSADETMEDNPVPMRSQHPQPSIGVGSLASSPEIKSPIHSESL